MRNSIFKTIFFFALALPSVVFTQTIKVLTLDEAIQLGLSNSKQLKVTGTKLDIAKAKRLQYWNALVPVVTLNSSYYRLSDNVDPFKIGTFEVPQILNQFTNRLSASEVIFSGFRAKNFYESAQFIEKAAALDLDKDKIEVKNNIVAAFFNYYKLLASSDILTENLNVLRGRLTDVKNFVKQGTALENDQLKAELAISQVELSQKEVGHAIAVANFNLNLLLGLPTETVLELDKNSFFAEKNISNLSSYLASVDSRPDLTASTLRVQAANKSVEIAKGGLLPTISVGANAYYNNPNQRVFPPAANFKGTMDIGLSLSYNLTNLYTGKYQIQEAQANALQANLLKSQLSDAAKMEINGNYYAYQSALEKIKLMEKTVAQATENQRVVNNRFKTQTSTTGELLEADSLLLQAKINLESARADAELAYHKLLKAVGK
ncbi:MAG: TolC family protein [Saprospiraceae bacterium]|nr:TolC family protein [Saprospiraceae bacterium]